MTFFSFLELTKETHIFGTPRQLAKRALSIKQVSK